MSSSPPSGAADDDDDASYRRAVLAMGDECVGRRAPQIDDRDRPLLLLPIEKSIPRVSTPTNSRHSLLIGKTPSRSLLSSFASRRALGTVLNQPRILRTLLECMPWADFHALTSTCRQFRQQLLTQGNSWELILSHFVPGYALCLQGKDPELFREVDTDMGDLSLLSASLFSAHSWFLHKY